jgi:hypothetical protein
LLNHGFPAPGRHLVTSSKRAMVAVATVFLVGGTSPAIRAAPIPEPVVTIDRAQNVNWLSPDQAAALNVGIDVLVPSWVPVPFDSVAPSISASNGYYELYWVVPGLPSTFLQIEGIAGGSFPAGSEANLNNELFINASVQGWEAIHDVGVPEGSDAPIYDRVWWIANGVLYSVNSWNMAGSDSMSLANSLISLQVPAPPVAEEPVAQDPMEEFETPPSDASGGTGPVVDDVPVLDDTVPVQEAPAEEPVTDDGTTDTSVVESDVPSETVPEEAGSTGGVGGDLPSDGTDGPPPPVTGSDGTGGTRDIALPHMP